MKRKAIFLLLIFLLNTVMGFGCALGIEGDHHEHKTISKAGLNFSEEDPCCKTVVNDLVTQSKLVPERSKIQVALPVIQLLSYSNILLITVTGVELDQSVYADQRERPPNRDIRIIIQSFQI